MSLIRCVLVAAALAAPPLAAEAQTCPVVNSSPVFTAGGSVFGRSVAQWNAYFGAKVDATNGVLCNPSIQGGQFNVGSITQKSAGPGFLLTDTVNQEFEVSTATVTATSNTTLTPVLGLTQVLSAGANYSCHGHLTGVSGAGGGIKVALVSIGGVLTATSATFTGFGWAGTTALQNTTVTSLGSSVIADTAVYSDLYIDGSILVNTTGTIEVEMAQNASNGTPTTVLVGSTFSCVRVS